MSHLQRASHVPETPPRAWGRPCAGHARDMHERNTPTGVGKTCLPCHRCNARWKHPHGRGEDAPRAPSRCCCMETPPRAWGRLALAVEAVARSRNTPTGVGKTASGVVPFASPWKHPHGRGEDPRSVAGLWIVKETPPRAWGRRRKNQMLDWILRNTPTGVGKTPPSSRILLLPWKHPHGRGEDSRSRRGGGLALETPPRAWGRHDVKKPDGRAEGNTPTGVGKTFTFDPDVASSWKHPHGRGEDPLVPLPINEEEETPPRAWGRLKRKQPTDDLDGNTPTGVGKTTASTTAAMNIKKHPHGRGEDACRQHPSAIPAETPPRAWGRLRQLSQWRACRGNTPTGVGKTVPTRCQS